MDRGVLLKKGEGRTIKAGGAWVFDNEIASLPGDVQDGEILPVYDFDGYPMGQGYINRRSKITVRMMTRRSEVPVDDAFLEQRVRDAWQYRKENIDISSCRIIFAEADFLPGLVVDKYADVLVVECLTLGMEKMKDRVLQLLKQVLSEDGIRIRGIYERSDAKVRLKEGLERIKGFIGEPFDTKVEILENGVRYMVDVAEGQKTGFFLDQKLNRMAVQDLVQRLCTEENVKSRTEIERVGKLSGEENKKEIRVLDCFTHTGSFALNAGLAGAASVLGLDASELAVAQARENAALNGLSDRVRFETADVLEWLPEEVKSGHQYDVVILDPPAFTKSRETIKKAASGYRAINVCGMKLIREGGYLATCTCSHFMDEAGFRKVLAESARSAHKRLKQVYFGTQAPDHPILWAADESYYLKFYIFQVVEER